MRRSSWVIQVDPKFQDKCLQERHREGDVRVEAEMGVMQAQAKACWEPQEAGRVQGGFFLEPQGHRGPAHTLILNLWPPELGDSKFLLH